MQTLDRKSTALVLIDLQKGILSRPLAPHTGCAVVETSTRLAERFRSAGAPVFLVRVGWSEDGKDRLLQPVDQPFSPPLGGMPEDFFEFVDGLRQPGDLIITKRQWSAFYGTELDLQLRRRRVETIVLAGVATNIGVESTARQAWEQGYSLVIVEDAMASQSEEMHRFAVETIFPRIARVRRSAELGF